MSMNPNLQTKQFGNGTEDTMFNPQAKLDGSQVELGPGVNGKPPAPPTDAFGNPKQNVGI